MSRGLAYRVAGRGGITGYVAVAFPKLGRYVIANVLYGDATYVIEGDEWKALSQPTQPEVLVEKPQFAYVIEPL